VPRVLNHAPGRFLSDPRNKLFKDYLRFLEEFEPKAFLFENVPGLLSLGDGKVFRQILREFDEHGYQVTVKILFAAHYGVPQERWRLISTRFKKVSDHCARANALCNRPRKFPGRQAP